ncbi:hypothetical protein D6C83_01646 [Aureobasidium pullulans]|uniref:Uncharacterized protein n=1 Tax=Aureobasidium pullulans TaxID=5580 RepID=A0A4T0E3F7_AURPU|nr:hypothetical protein D6C83_01646 [Aureobasidium pullulans]
MPTQLMSLDTSIMLPNAEKSFGGVHWFIAGQSLVTGSVLGIGIDGIDICDQSAITGTAGGITSLA